MNRIDKLFKKAIEEKTYEPPVRLWADISGELEKRRKKKKVLIRWYSGAAAVVLLFTCGILMTVLKEKADEAQILYSRELTSAIKRQKIEIEPERTVILLSEKVNFPEIQNREKNVFDTKNNDVPVCIQKMDEVGNIIPLLYYNIKTPAIRTEIIPLINRQAYKMNRLYNKLLEENNRLDKKEKTGQKKSLHILLSGHVSPGYASGKYTIPDKESRAYVYDKDQLEGVFSMSGGLKIAFSTGKRLFVQTGIIYTQTGQRTRENSSYGPQSVLLDINRHSRYISSPLGKIKSKKAFIYNSELPAVSLSAVRSRRGNIEQFFEAVEIPLAVKYKLNDNKLSFTVLGGVSGSFLVSNKAYLNDGNKREYVGSTEDIRPFNISTDFSIGVEYPVSSRIRVMLEPGVRYYLQSLSRNEQVNFKPYVFSFSTGIGINF